MLYLAALLPFVLAKMCEHVYNATTCTLQQHLLILKLLVTCMLGI